MAKVMRALMESSVVENATRLRILTNADRKIDEKMEALRQEARRLRQQSITAELLDILIGAEASEFDR
jgi:F0F1-type ATP synthase gamma subunit